MGQHPERSDRQRGECSCRPSLRHVRRERLGASSRTRRKNNDKAMVVFQGNSVKDEELQRIVE